MTAAPDGLRSTRFAVPGMDCPSEERMIRLALTPHAGVRRMSFDLQGRRLEIVHDGPPDGLLDLLEPLGFGARLEASRPATADEALAGLDSPADAAAERHTLRLLLAINAAMFAVELVTGFLAQSTGLIADSLDMFADAAVYGLSLYAVGHGLDRQRRAARLSGVLQVLLAVGVLVEVARRALTGSAPEPPLMIGIATLALAANVGCLLLLARHRHGGAHMRASWIFSTNDVLANLGVIVAAGLVAWTGSPAPDLAVGLVIGAVVLGGGIRILRLR